MSDDAGPLVAGRSDLRAWRIPESTTAPPVEVPFPLAELEPDGSVRWANASWHEMAAARRGDPRQLSDATGVAGSEFERLRELIATAGRGQPGSTELDIPNLGLYRWSRCVATPADGGRAVLCLVPLRQLPERDQGPDPDEFIANYEYLSEGIVVLDEHMRIRIATGFAANFMGRPGYAYEGRDAIDELHPADRIVAAEAFAGILDHPGEQIVRDLRIVDSEGGYRWVEVVATNLFGHPTVQGILLMLRDIAARKHAEEFAGRLVRVLDSVPDIVVLFDRDGTPLYCNPAAIEAAGDAAADPASRGAALRHLTRRLHRQLPATMSFRDAQPWEGEVTLAGADGEIRTFSVVVVATHEDNELDFFACIGRDITDRKQLEAELAHRALHDPLTGLPNRAAILDRLGRALREQPFADQALAVMFLDLDNLKDVNDSVGHDAGDSLLVEVARRLRAATRPTDVVARLGGDEFVVLCPALADGSTALEIAERIRRAVTGRSVVSRTDVFIGVSIGVTVVPPHRDLVESAADDALRMLRDADTAMYQAKLRGRARVVLFSSDMHERAHARMQLTAGLDRAITDGQLTLVYQPILDIASHRPVGLEALLRWHHPELGPLFPDRFIDLAEESGLIVPLGNWVLNQAATDIAALRGRSPDYSSLTVNVNVSARQLLHDGFSDLVASTLVAHRIDSDALVLEVTESTLVDEITGRSRVIDRLRQLGVRIAIDDFGTGYSSLSYLRRFAVDELKLDGSFVDDIVSSPVSANIARAVVELAHAIGLTVVAESVESTAQLEALTALGCDRAQGYLIGHPVPAREVPALLGELGAQIG